MKKGTHFYNFPLWGYTFLVPFLYNLYTFVYSFFLLKYILSFLIKKKKNPSLRNVFPCSYIPCASKGRLHRMTRVSWVWPKSALLAWMNYEDHPRQTPTFQHCPIRSQSHSQFKLIGFAKVTQIELIHWIPFYYIFYIFNKSYY